jgi:pimeloyl-ACP methyl ester carboxylesterase
VQGIESIVTATPTPTPSKPEDALQATPSPTDPGPTKHIGRVVAGSLATTGSDMVETTTVQACDGRRLALCEWGDPAGMPLFYLHGTPGGRLLRSVGGEYERQGIRAITYDRPGYGRSTRQPGRLVRDAAADVQVIADLLGIDRFAVVGVSSGGPHTLAVAAGLPDRVTRCATIKGVGPRDARDLDLFDGMSPEDRRDWDTIALGEEYNDRQVYRETLQFVDVLKTITDLPVHIRDMLVEAVGDALAPGPGGLFDDYAAASQPWGFDLDAISCPVTIMIAEDDTNVPPAHGAWLAQHLTQAQVISVPGGHLGPHEEPEERILAWAVESDSGSASEFFGPGGAAGRP